MTMEPPKKKSRCPLDSLDQCDTTTKIQQPGVGNVQSHLAGRHSNLSGKVALPTVQTPELSTRTGPAESLKKG